MEFFQTRHVCGRRYEGLQIGSWPAEPTVRDRFARGHGLVGQNVIGGGCTYCGSAEPAKLLSAVQAGWSVHGSDKNYKWYVDRPWTEEELLQRQRAWIESPWAQQVARAARNSGQDVERCLDAAYRREQQHPGGITVAKFYTVHLNRAQAKSFLDLWSEHPDRIRMYSAPWLPALNDKAPGWLVAGHV